MQMFFFIFFKLLAQNKIKNFHSFKKTNVF